MTRHALVAGASGLVGARLLARLLADERYAQVTAIVRRELPIPDRKLRQIRSSFTDLDDHLDALRADDVFCALGTTRARAGSAEAFARVDHDLVLVFAQAARRAGSRQFLLVSAVGAAETAPTFYSRTKGRVETSLRALGYDTLHLVRPSLLLGARGESRPLESVAQRLAPVARALLRGRLARYAPVSADTVARVLVTAALRDERGVHVHEAPFGSSVSLR